MPQTYDGYVREVTRTPKRKLVDLVEQWAREHGRRWVIGGPRHWSKDELVAAALRIHRGEEP